MPVKNPLDVLDRMRADLRVTASRLAWTAAYALLAITATIGGIGFLLAALHTYLAARTSPAEAGLIVGGLLLVVAAGLLAVAARGLRPARPSRESPGRPTGSRTDDGPRDSQAAAEFAADLGENLGRQGVDWARSHPFAACAAALAAGVAFGASPGLRRSLTGRSETGRDPE